MGLCLMLLLVLPLLSRSCVRQHWEGKAKSDALGSLGR